MKAAAFLPLFIFLLNSCFVELKEDNSKATGKTATPSAQKTTPEPHPSPEPELRVEHTPPSPGPEPEPEPSKEATAVSEPKPAPIQALKMLEKKEPECGYVKVPADWIININPFYEPDPTTSTIKTCDLASGKCPTMFSKEIEPVKSCQEQSPCYPGCWSKNSTSPTRPPKKP